MENKNNKIVNNCYDFASILMTSIISVAFIFCFLFKISSVVGGSMNDTLNSNDKVIITALDTKPEYGDIVVISQPNIFNEVIIKRVIATGGQKVIVDANKGTVSVDGKILKESYIKESYPRVQGNMSYPITVPEGYVFVMGDNRNHSTDSRFSSIGLIDERYIMGKAFYRVGDKSLLTLEK